MIKSHIAQRGTHAGEYVPCHAQYIPCRIANRADHVYFADRPSMERFNGLATQMRLAFWASDETHDINDARQVMDSLSSGSVVSDDDYVTAFDAIRSRNDAIWGAGHGMTAPADAPDARGVIMDAGWSMTSSHHDAVIGPVGDDSSDDITYGDGDTVMVLHDSQGYDSMRGGYDDRHVSVRYQDMPDSSMEYFYDGYVGSGLPVLDTARATGNHDAFVGMVRAMREREAHGMVNLCMTTDGVFMVSGDHGYHHAYSCDGFIRQYPESEAYLHAMQPMGD